MTGVVAGAAAREGTLDRDEAPTQEGALDRDAIDAARPAPASFVESCGPTLVIAPHPDDESIGCGGLIALLREAEVPVCVALMSDGSMSHPGSVLFDAAARRSLRENELRHALQLLGVARDHLRTMGLPDGAVPAGSRASIETIATTTTTAHSAAAVAAVATGRTVDAVSEEAAPGRPADVACDLLFTQAVTALHALIFEFAPATIVVPWRRDPHPDHRACWHIAMAACRQLEAPPRVLEYLVWTIERGDAASRPRADEVRAWRLDVTPVLAAKRAAIEAHRSQLGLVIRDDPNGFTLPPEMVARACAPFETYLEPIDHATAFLSPTP